MKRPFLYCAIGSLIASLVAVKFTQHSPIFFLFCVILVVVNFLFYIRTQNFVKSLCIFASMLVVFFVSSVTYYTSILPIAKLEGKTVNVKAMVLENPMFYDDHISYSVEVLNVESIDCPTFKADIVDFSGVTVAEVSDVISANVRFANTSTSESKPSYYSNNVYLNGSFATNLEVLGQKTDFLISARKYINDFFASVLPTDISSVLSALTIGDKSYLGDGFLENIRFSGVSHIMVVSGLHLAIICRFLMYVLNKFFNKKLSALICLISIAFIVALCSFSVSSLRSGFMYAIMLLGVILLKRPDSINSLCIAATAILILNPFAIANVSFQLSFAATLGIILICPLIINKAKQFIPKNKFYKISYAICELLALNFAATITTLPICVYQFGELSIISPVTNILISYSVTASLILAQVSLLMSLIPYAEFVYMPIIFICGLVTRYINWIINTLGSLKWASVSVNNNSAFVILMIYAAIFVALYYFKRSRKYAYS